MRDKLLRAYPGTPSSFDARMRRTLTSLPPRTARNGRRVAAVALAVVMLATCSLALAATRSRLLERLFPGIAPTPQAERLLVQLGATVERDGVSLTIDEYLLDGNDLYVTWMARSERNEPLMLLVSNPETPGAGEDILDDSLVNWRMVQGVLLDEAHPGYSATSRVHFPDGAPTESFEVAFTAALLAPEAPIVDARGAETFSDAPTLLRNDYGESGVALMAVSDLRMSGDGYAADSGLDGSIASFDDAVRALEKAGYAREVARIPVKFEVTPDARNTVHTRVVGGNTFAFDRFRMVVDAADFTAAGVDIRYRIFPVESDASTSFAAGLWFDVLPNGERADNGFMSSMTATRDMLSCEIMARPTSEIPDWVRLVACDETGNPLPQYTVDLRLIRVGG